MTPWCMTGLAWGWLTPGTARSSPWMTYSGGRLTTSTRSRVGLDMDLATAWRMGHVRPHMAGAAAGLQKIRTFYDCLHAAHRKTRLGSMPFHQIVGELDWVDDHGNKMQPNIPDIWRTAVKGEFPDCLAQSVAQVLRSMCGPLAVCGTREGRAVIIRRDLDKSAFTRGDKIMGIPWRARLRRPRGKPKGTDH